MGFIDGDGLPHMDLSVIQSLIIGILQIVLQAGAESINTRQSVIIGVLQGIFEWLPISSEGNITLYLTAIEGLPAKLSVKLSLFLHAGTALSAIGYYRDEILSLLQDLPKWRPDSAFSPGTAQLSFFAIGTLVSGLVGVVSYTALEQFVNELAGGVFIALIGVLLIITGLFQLVANDDGGGGKDTPDLTDAVLVGLLQGLAILPGVSRSGTTVSALLLRDHDGPTSFHLSFILSIPAAIGGGLIVFLDEGMAIDPTLGLVALLTSAVVGYLTIDLLIRIVNRVAFWGICFGLGAIAVFGGVIVSLI